MKMTFKEFLMEVDASDLDWAKSIANDKKRSRMIQGTRPDPLNKKKPAAKSRPRQVIQDTRTSL